MNNIWQVWRKLIPRGRSDGAGRKQIQRRWDDDRGVMLYFRRESPGAIAGYKINRLGCSESLLLLCDELQPIREWLRNEGLSRRLRIPRELELGILAALNTPEQTHIVIIAWQSQSLYGTRFHYRVLGIYSLDLSTTHPPRIRAAIHRIAIFFWEWQVPDSLWKELIERVDFASCIIDSFRGLTSFPVVPRRH